MRAFFLVLTTILISFSLVLATDSEEENSKEEVLLSRHKVGLYLGNSLIREVHNTRTGKEQYVLAPTFGIDYEYWLSHKWAIGTYNELALLNIEVEHEEEEFLKRENVLLFSGVAIWEPFPRFAIFAGTGVETDPNHTFWIRFMGAEYAFVRCDNWDVSVSAGYINRQYYDVFSFGIVIGKRFGKHIPERHH